MSYRHFNVECYHMHRTPGRLEILIDSHYWAINRNRSDENDIGFNFPD